MSRATSSGTPCARIHSSPNRRHAETLAMACGRTTPSRVRRRAASNSRRWKSRFTSVRRQLHARVAHSRSSSGRIRRGSPSTISAWRWSMASIAASSRRSLDPKW
ncbi:hypothetical protein BC477_02365 [Clavibacter michiganensis subsp. michiganensis]|uniref:Uncharacterized protein n=1 Tax=Clavibacter michiganensis subsp. michiganensis TaxID=33013 RepID=A0A251XJ28_CLAMM|nr:hypothetical protein BC477_02365 [Clavibacter michiganensis subsp. michiganensis]OUE03554.1 hypothetical protein CMMCAS07_01300 [Clavibacter michiganensis subsp. michiganensis]